MAAKGIDAKSNPVLVELIGQLRTAGRTNEAPVWRDIASRLEKPSRSWAQVNVSKVALHLQDGEHAIIPGKLLGDGEIGKAVTVIAFNCSASAKAKITKAGGKVLNFQEGIKAFPKGKGCRIIG